MNFNELSCHDLYRALYRSVILIIIICLAGDVPAHNFMCSLHCFNLHLKKKNRAEMAVQIAAGIVSCPCLCTQSWASPDLPVSSLGDHRVFSSVLGWSCCFFRLKLALESRWQNDDNFRSFLAGCIFLVPEGLKTLSRRVSWMRWTHASLILSRVSSCYFMLYNI